VKEMKLLGITAIVSVGLASLLCGGILATMQTQLLPLGSTSIIVDSGSWNSINATLNPNDRWVVDYQTMDTMFIHVYLLTYTQYHDYQYMGGISGNLGSRSGSTGKFDYTASTSDTYFLLFLNDAAYAAKIYLNIVEVVVDTIPIPDF
jgi:hypothetical protein